MSVILDAFERAELRSYLTDTLPSSCVVQAVADANGARTPIATVACRVVDPRSSEGAEYLGDRRVVRVLVPPESVTAGADVVVVDGAAEYRIFEQFDMSIPSTCRTRPAHILPGAWFAPHNARPPRSTRLHLRRL